MTIILPTSTVKELARSDCVGRLRCSEQRNAGYENLFVWLWRIWQMLLLRVDSGREENQRRESGNTDTTRTLCSSAVTALAISC
jgi:hypothetical protein